MILNAELAVLCEALFCQLHLLSRRKELEGPVETCVRMLFHPHVLSLGHM